MNLEPTVKHSAATHFLNAYTKALKLELKEKADLSRLLNLRCSQLPYCPSSMIIGYLANDTYRYMSMSGGFYTSVGTAVHSVLQKYLPHTLNILGNYQCHHCLTKFPMSYTPECPHCDLPTHYEEIDIDYKGIQGHIDTVTRIGKKNLWVVDYKTSGTSALESKASSPPENYKWQVRSYIYLLRRQYKLKCKGAMLAFISRDNPDKKSIWVEEYTDDIDYRTRQFLKKNLRLQKATLAAITRRDLVALLKVNCGNPYCKYCSKGLDFKKQQVAALYRQKKLPMIKHLKG